MRARIATVVLLAAAGCNNPTYLPETRALDTSPADGGTGTQVAQDLYVLPVRMPTDAETRILAAEQMLDALPVPIPWAASRDFDIEVEYSITNAEMTPVTAFFSMNGGNEFGDYVPSAYIDPTANEEDQTPPPPLLGGSPVTLNPGETRTGIFREDEIREAGLDLEAITRYPDPMDILSTPFKVIVHNSTASNIGLEQIPPNDVIPAMVRFAFLLTADGHVTAHYSVRVREQGNKLAKATDPNLYVSTAAMLTPPAAPPVPGGTTAP